MITSSVISKTPKSSFEDNYIALRRTEGRLLTDDEVRNLPYISPSKHHQNEWALRARSAIKLFKHLAGLKRSLAILEVGCGNGWLSNYLSKLNKSDVTGIDPNSIELEQAKRVFRKQNLQFRNGKFPDIIDDIKYDVIVFAASIQYFASLTKVLQQSIDLLNRNGEVHIIDTHFYNEDEVPKARERSRIYFNRIGFSEMIESYHHHSEKELQEFDAISHNRSVGIINKLFNRTIFPWYSIVNK